MDLPYKYIVCGLEISSEIELPGALAVDADHPFDVTIRFGEVPKSLSIATARGAAFDANANEVLLRVPNVAAYYIHHGREVVIEPQPNTTQNDVRAFLTTSSFGALIHQRGMVPLHASAVRVGDRVIGFLGDSGAGKSTLCAALNGLGFPVFADDVIAVRWGLTVGPLAFPGFTRLRLWEDSAKALGIRSEGLPRVRESLYKFELHAPNHHRGTPLPLHRLYLLADTNGATPEGGAAITGPRRLEVLLRNTYRAKFLSGMAEKGEHFRTCAGMLKHVQLHQLTRRLDLSRLQEVAESLAYEWEQERIANERPFALACAVS